MSGMRVLGRAAVLVALGAAALAPRARAQSVVVGPLPSSMSAIPGVSITVPVVADLTSSGGASLGSATLRLTWHAGTLTYVSTGAGAVGSPTVNADSASAGILKVAVANPGGASGMPVLFNATFNVTGAPADTTILGLSVGEITAAGTFANLLPITAATRASFCTSTGLWGDVDADDAFTGHDALIILTYAVGLPVAPYSVVNGDVDNDGSVDTRDALIVLSEAVGIPVTQFRIGHINAGVCSLRSAATAQIQPRTPTVAPGDSLPVTVVVKDSTGALVQGVGLVWQTKDSTVVRPGTDGSLVAVAPGTTYAFVYVQPGVEDSVPVTVTPTRHVWYVNPAVAAANLGVELGSQLYPYASIDTAMAHAAANDTIHVATADYGSVIVRKPLVLLGDSSAGGFPRLSNPLEAALHVDTVAGAVTVSGFRLLNSAKGVSAKLVQTLTLGRLSVEGVHDVGILAYGVDSLTLSHAQVIGAVGTGVLLDSVRAVALDHVRSDAIAASSGGGSPLALKVAQTTALGADSVTLGAGAFVDSAQNVSLRRLRVANSSGPALVVNGGTITVVAGDFSGATAGGAPTTYAVALDAGASLEFPAGPVRFDSSQVRNNGLWALSVIGGTTVSLRADTVTGNYAGEYDAVGAIYDFGRLSLAHTAFVNNGSGYVDIEGTAADTVTADTTVFDGTEVYVYDVAALLMHGGAVRNGTYPPMLDVESTPAVELDSIEAAGGRPVYGSGPAVGIYDADTVTVNGINAHDNWPSAVEVEYAAALSVNGGSMLDNGGPNTGTTRATLSSYDVGETRVYGLTLRDSADVGVSISPTGPSRAVVDSSFLEGSQTLVRDLGGGYPDTLTVSRSSLTGFGGTSSYGVDAEYVANVVVTGSFLDSLGFDALYASGVDTTIASQNTIRAWGSSGLEQYAGALTADSNAFAGCVPGDAAIYAGQPSTVSVAGNILTGCGSLVWVAGQYASSGPAVAVTGNTLTRDTTASQPGIYLQNGLGFVQVTGNVVTGGRSPAIIVSGAGYSIDSARVDSNTIRQVNENGVEAAHVGKLTLTYNLLADNSGTGLMLFQPFSALYNTVVRNAAGGVFDSSGSGPSSFRYGNLVGNHPFGIATNAPSMAADSNWWGDLSGPRCDTCAGTGDSVWAGVNFLPYDSAFVALAPADPGPPAVSIARLLAVRAASVPRSPKARAGVQGPPRGAAAAAQAARPRAVPAVPRPVRPTGRVIGHHRPAWQTGVSR